MPRMHYWKEIQKRTTDLILAFITSVKKIDTINLKRSCYTNLELLPEEVERALLKLEEMGFIRFNQSRTEIIFQEWDDEFQEELKKIKEVKEGNQNNKDA